MTWKAAPGDSTIYLYGHETVLNAWVDGSIRLVQGETVVVVLEGKGQATVSSVTFVSPEPEPGMPYITTVELTEDCFGANGLVNGTWQHYRADQKGVT